MVSVGPAGVRPLPPSASRSIKKKTIKKNHHDLSKFGSCSRIDVLLTCSCAWAISTESTRGIATPPSIPQPPPPPAGGARPPASAGMAAEAAAAAAHPSGKGIRARTLRWLYAAHILQCLSTTIREQAAPDMVFRLFDNDMVKSCAAARRPRRMGAAAVLTRGRLAGPRSSGATTPSPA